VLFSDPRLARVEAHPAYQHIGDLNWPFRHVQFTVANVGTVPLIFSRVERSSRLAVFHPATPSRRILQPGTALVHGALLSAAGVNPGDYRAGFRYYFRSGSETRTVTAELGFAVPARSAFSFDVHPRLIRRMAGRGPKRVEVYCVNYSDTLGVVAVEFHGLKSQARSLRVSLGARESKRLALSAERLAPRDPVQGSEIRFACEGHSVRRVVRFYSS
jgi:hypothetical protein